MVLVDHNNVVAEIEHLKDSIVRVIDHHRIVTNAFYSLNRKTSNLKCNLQSPWAGNKLKNG